MQDVEIMIAVADERITLTNLMQLYIHDFSEHWSGTTNGDVQNNGRFADYPLDAYWSKPGYIPLLLRIENHLAGFALINSESHSGHHVEHNMAEFFILRKYRRCGTGTRAAHFIFSQYPGSWETAVARRNGDAFAFWQRAINSHPTVSTIEEMDVQNAAWNGPIIRFRIG